MKDEHLRTSIRNELEAIAKEPKLAARFPRLTRALLEIGSILDKMKRALEQDLSGDVSIEDDKDFESGVLAKLFFAARRFRQ